MEVLTHFETATTSPFPFVGSHKSQAEGEGMADVGLRALQILGPDSAAQVRSNLPIGTSKRTALPLHRATAVRDSAFEAFAISARRQGQQITPEIEKAIAAGKAYEQNDHELFMRAMNPSSSDNQAGSNLGESLKDNVVKAVFGPDVTEFRHAVDSAMPHLVEVDSPWYQRGSVGHPTSVDVLDSRHRADTEWQRQTNSWSSGRSMSVMPLLQPSVYTDCDSPDIIQCAESMLSMPRLGHILLQEFADGTLGTPVTICGHDMETYTFDKLQVHPVYGSLVRGGGLLAALRGPEMERLIKNSESPGPLAGIAGEMLDKLAMAQRIASVVIHYAVRDSIKYELGGWCRTATEVLLARSGSCSCKANVAVALGRAVNLPCGACRVHVEIPGYFGLSLGPNILPMRERVSVHYHIGWVILQKIDGNLSWQCTMSDPSDNFELATGARFNFPGTRLVSFDGVHHSLLNFSETFVYDMVGPVYEIDRLIDKKPIIFPSASERRQLLRVAANAGLHQGVDDRKLAKAIKKHVSRLEETRFNPTLRCAEQYPTLSREYQATLCRLLADPATSTVFKDISVSLEAFFADQRTVQQLVFETVYDSSSAKNIELDDGANRRHASNDWVSLYLRYAQSNSRCANNTAMVAQKVSALMNVVRGLVDLLSKVPLTHRLGFPFGFVACQRAQALRSLGPDASTRKKTLERHYLNTYQFMAHCYPDTSGEGHGQVSGWLPRSEQERYVAFLLSTQARSLAFDDILGNALVFCLGIADLSYLKDSSTSCYKPIGQICRTTGLSYTYLSSFIRFHQHLLSTPTTAVMNCFLRYVAEEVEGKRCSPGLHLEFEAWLSRKYPTLAGLHRAELAENAEYPRSVYVFLLGRTAIQTPSPDRLGLASFIKYINNLPSTMCPATGAEMDESLRQFLGPDGPTESMIGERQGGLLKPYGVLYTLWKAYTLPPSETRNILARLCERSTLQRPHRQQDWLETDVAEYQFQPRL